MNHRSSGILLHITSLPSAYGIGDLGPEAYRFVDFLSAAGQSYWQVLPLNPTGTYLGNSPYTSYSVFAGNPLLVSPELLMKSEYLTPADLKTHPAFSRDHVNYHAVVKYKSALFQKAFHEFRRHHQGSERYLRFCSDNAYWLNDFCLFAALKSQFDEIAWDEWPEEVRDRDPSALESWKEKLADRINLSRFFQYVFFEQWTQLREYANSKGVRIIGDIPIYPSFDSSDAWANPEFFKLDEKKEPLYVAGAPPDYFSATGQRWGNPVYDWDRLKETNYQWWIQRIQHNLQFCDVVRVDHFRGFVAYWEIPAEEDTAINGKWVTVPAMDFFETILQQIPNLPLIVEDLGMITPDVRELMDHFGFPGMKVLLFAFGPDLPTHPYAPHNYSQNCVVYTGTHDNNTIRGWFEKEAQPQERLRLLEYVGYQVDESNVHQAINRLALASIANLCILPIQDVLGLGSEARMNFPSRSEGNWGWRVLPEALSASLAESLLKLTRLYGR